jgi:hypothetical protein
MQPTGTASWLEGLEPSQCPLAVHWIVPAATPQCHRLGGRAVQPAERCRPASGVTTLPQAGRRPALSALAIQ